MSILPGFANEYKQTSNYVYVDALGTPLPFKIQEAEQKGNGVNAWPNAQFKHGIDNQKRLIFFLEQQLRFLKTISLISSQ